MDSNYPVKEEEYSYPSEQQPRPMEGLHEMGPPPFLNKTYDMVDGSTTDHIVSWSRNGQCFVVLDTHAFSASVLPRYFKHNNFSSFVRQLNTYGFRKVDPDKWEFANEFFLQGHKHLLKNISRRKGLSQPLAITQQQPAGPCVELGRFGLETKVDRLRRDKQVLMMELVKLKQQQQNARVYLQEMDLRLQGTERKQRQMMSFLAKAMQNPDFINQFIRNKEKRKELEEAVNKKRRRPIEVGESSRAYDNRVKVEPLEFSDGFGFEMSELEALAFEMQGYGRVKRDQEEDEEHDIEQLESYERELDDGFWEELFKEGFDGGTGMAKNEQGNEDDNVDVLADRLESLGSSPK